MKSRFAVSPGMCVSDCYSAVWTQRALSLLYKRWRSRTFSSSRAGIFYAKNI